MEKGPLLEGGQQLIRECKKVYPPATIGIIGGGQLGRMLSFEAKRMGYRVAVLDPNMDAPAVQVSDYHVQGSYHDLEAFRKLASMSDVLTYEFEHLNADLLLILEKEGHSLFPSANTLKTIQNKFEQKNFLTKIGIAVPDYKMIRTCSELESFYATHNNRAVVKTCTGGYDGKGNYILDEQSALRECYEYYNGIDIMAEEYVDFEKEVSIVVAKSASETILYPISENTHKKSILIKSLIPADISEAVRDSVCTMATRIVDALNDYGIFCIEFFVNRDSGVFVNEIAPRPHNTGHYSIEACITSQFEQLIRVLCAMPLGSSEMRMPAAMYNILGHEELEGEYVTRGIEEVLAVRDCHFHLYGKGVGGYLKKLGHITALDSDIRHANEKAKKAVKNFEIKSGGLINAKT